MTYRPARSKVYMPSRAPYVVLLQMQLFKDKEMRVLYHVIRDTLHANKRKFK